MHTVDGAWSHNTICQAGVKQEYSSDHESKFFFKVNSTMNSTNKISNLHKLTKKNIGLLPTEFMPPLKLL